jgi:hypothetical protein
VFVTDATSGSRANLDSGHHLVVGDGSGVLTIDGTVNQRVALPTKRIVIGPYFVGNSVRAIYGPVSKAFGITTVDGRQLHFFQGCTLDEDGCRGRELRHDQRR